MTELKQEFWTRMGNVRAAMLGVKGQGRLVAMSPQLDGKFPATIWFITAKGTDLAQAVQGGAQDAQLVISDGGAGLYGDVDGTLSQSTDQQVLDDVWSFATDAWFEGGKNDPDVCLMRFMPKSGEISVTPTSGVKFLYEIAKAKFTGAKPDAGEQGVVTF